MRSIKALTTNKITVAQTLEHGTSNTKVLG